MRQKKKKKNWARATEGTGDVQEVVRKEKRLRDGDEEGKEREEEEKKEKEVSFSQTPPASLRAHLQRGADSLSLRALSQRWFL